MGAVGWFFLGMAAGPILCIFVTWLLRDVLPPTLFMPSDWDD